MRQKRCTTQLWLLYEALISHNLLLKWDTKHQEQPTDYTAPFLLCPVLHLPQQLRGEFRIMLPEQKATVQIFANEAKKEPFLSEVETGEQTGAINHLRWKAEPENVHASFLPNTPCVDWDQFGIHNTEGKANSLETIFPHSSGTQHVAVWTF